MREEIENLKRDKDILMSEVVRLRQQQQSAQQEIAVLSQCLQNTEHKQQQMMMFLAKAVRNPSFVAQVVQKNEHSKHLQDVARKRNLPEVGSSNAQEKIGSQCMGNLQEGNQSMDFTEELLALLQEIAQEQYSGDRGEPPRQTPSIVEDGQIGAQVTEKVETLDAFNEGIRKAVFQNRSRSDDFPHDNTDSLL
ncbi:hypothetical protein KP509_02G104000 [Ceratopteris richardii]|nr:hypothetical protein KP509_02G104000 [Ceratopteris richardii]